MRESPDLKPLLSPESVAVVGASPDSWYSSQLMDNLLDYGFNDPVYPVNPNRERVWDRKCYDSISEVPETVDLVVVSVPREFVNQVVDNAGEMGIPAALIITAGFSESDRKGQRLETELESIVAKHSMVVCGPNCVGIANPLDETVLTSTCSRKPGKGSIGLVSQSGALAFTTFFERAADNDVDFAYLISTGNEVGLSVADYVDYLAGQDDVDVICTYIEGIDNPRRFMDAAKKARENDTPVLTVKVGRTEEAENASISHTGSLTGNDDIWQAALDQTGVERVDDITGLLTKASLHATAESPDSNRVCIASTSGGLASLLADLSAERDLELPSIEGTTQDNLQDIEDLLTYGDLHNPADIRGYGADVLEEIATIVFADDTYDSYVFAVGLPAVDERAEDIANQMINIQQMADDPVVFLWTGRKDPMKKEKTQPFERVQQEMPLFFDPKASIEALSSLVHFSPAETEELRYTIKSEGQNNISDENSTDKTLIWEEAESLLHEAGVNTIKTYTAKSSGEAVEMAKKIDNPVVLKVDSRDIHHRNDIGGVITNLERSDQVESAYGRILDKVEKFAPEATINGILVQPWIEHEIEAFIGMSRDQLFGPSITLGTGGTAVEIFEDSAICIPPFSKSVAMDAMRDTKIPALFGHHGVSDQSSEDFASMVESVGKLSNNNQNLLELDLNPIILVDGEWTAVDALVRSR